jgi:hypothetical protein
MSTERDVTRIVRSWLEEGGTVVPDRVLDAVLDQVPTTPQRRAFLPVRRLPIVNSTALRIGIVAAVLIIAAVVGWRLLPGSVSPGGPPALTAKPTPIPKLNSQGLLPAGRYQVDATLPMKVTVAVPDGWSTDTNWVVIGPNGNQAPNGMAIRFHTVKNLLVHPLSPSDGAISPPVGPSVDDLVKAMVNHRDWTTTGPSPITIDGYVGQVVHVTLPAGTSEATPFYLSGDELGGDVYGWVAGQVFDIYVIDVGGKRLVIDAFHYPGTSAEDLAAQRAVLDSVQLAPTP